LRRSGTFDDSQLWRADPVLHAFISPRTAQFHLSSVFTKLGISSRGQLRRVLPADPGAVPPR
jgi:hypothetical protein